MSRPQVAITSLRQLFHRESSTITGNEAIMFSARIIRSALTSSSAARGWSIALRSHSDSSGPTVRRSSTNACGSMSRAPKRSTTRISATEPGDLRRTDVFIITLGLSEYGPTSRRGRCSAARDSAQQVRSIASWVQDFDGRQNFDNLATIYRIIRQRRPEAAIVLTLSPVPLFATFRPVSCVTANSVSKAILRVAIDEFHRGSSGRSAAVLFPVVRNVKDNFSDPYRGEIDT